MRSRQGELFAGLVLLSLALACFARLAARPTWLLVDGERPSIDHAQRDDFRPVGNDLTFFYLPHYLQITDELARLGRVAQWDSSGFAGRPRVGNPQAGLFYPPFRFTWGKRNPAVLGWLTIGHVLWSSLGLFLLMRSLGAGVAASTVAAGCFQASPYLIAQVVEGHYPHVWAVAWYPWAFAAFVQLRRRRWVGALALAPILALTLLTGHPQEWYYLTFVLSLWALGDAVYLSLEGQWRPAIMTIGGWCVVVGLSLGLSAVELIPDMAAQTWTLRDPQLLPARVSRYHLQLLNLFQLLTPGALGGPSDYFGRDNYWETVLSIGLIPLVLAAVAVARHPDRRLVHGWLVLVVGTLWFAAGRRLGLHWILFEVVPGMSRFRVPARSLFLATLGAAVLAGLGVEALRGRSWKAEDWQWLARRLRLGAVLTALVLLGLLPRSIGAVPNSQAPPKPALTLREIRQTLRNPIWERYQFSKAAWRVVQCGPFWFAVGGIGFVVIAGRRWPTASPLGFSGGVLLGMLGLLELGAHGYGVISVASPSRFFGPDPISQALRRAEPPVPGPFRIRARDRLYSDLRAIDHGFEKINVNDSFQLQHASDLYKPLFMLLYAPQPVDPNVPMDDLVARHKQESNQRLLDRLNVAFLVSDHVEANSHWPLEATGSWEGSPFAVHRNPTALPRAYVVPRAVPTEVERVATLARFREIDPREAVLLPSDPLETTPAGARQPYTPAMVNTNDPDRVVISVTTEAPGLLVLADTWMPGWSAQDNGRPVRLLRGNHAQCVVPLNQGGRHEVILRYTAPGLSRGLAVTMAATATWAALFLVAAAWSIASRHRRQATIVSPAKMASIVDDPGTPHLKPA